MPQVSGSLVEGKPLVFVTVADALPAPPEVSPQSSPIEFQVHHYRALLDTGANITCLCDNVIRERHLRPQGFIRMIGGLGSSLHETHIVRLGIVCENTSGPGYNSEPRGLFQLEPVEAAAIRENQWFDIIIGTDIHIAARITALEGWSVCHGSYLASGNAVTRARNIGPVTRGGHRRFSPPVDNTTKPLNSLERAKGVVRYHAS